MRTNQDVEVCFSIRAADAGHTYTVACTGEVDAAATKPLRDATLLALNSRCPLIVIDLREVTFIDSSGLSSLLLAHKAAEIAGVQLQVTAAPPQVMRTFRNAGIERLFERSAD